MLNKVIKTSATWCQPCKAYKPTFEKVKEMDEFKNLIFEEIDVEDEGTEELVEKYKVQSVPTTLFLDESGNLINRLVGVVSFQTLIDTINKELKETES